LNVSRRAAVFIAIEGKAYKKVTRPGTARTRGAKSGEKKKKERQRDETT
jgi:hypothetical protein